VSLVSSAEETAKDVYKVLTRQRLLRPDDAARPEHVFRTTGPEQAQAAFIGLSHRFLGPEISALSPVGPAGSVLGGVS
jgi:glutamate racemase